MNPANLRTPGALALGVCQYSYTKCHALHMNSKKMIEEFVEFLSDEQKEKFARIICDTPSEYLEVIIRDMGGFEGIAAWGLW